MNLETLIENLKEDLKNERKHMLFYLTNASTITGLNRIEIKEFLLEEAASVIEVLTKNNVKDTELINALRCYAEDLHSYGGFNGYSAVMSKAADALDKTR